MKRLYLLVMVFGLSVSTAQAAALANLDQSATALGVANAFTATATDPSAMYYNPAGIAWQEGVGVMFAGAMRYRDSSVKLTGGVAPNTASPNNLASLYVGWMPRSSNWGLGFGAFSTYSINNDWASAFGGSGQVTKFDTPHIALDVVYAMNSDMAVAVGGDWYTGKLDVNSSTTTFHGKDNTSFGGHVSWMWHPRPDWSVGALYRSRTNMKLAGTATGTVSGTAHVNMKLPDEVRVGVAHDFSDSIKVELDGSWSNWSRMADMNVVGTTTETNALNLRDSFSAMAGLTWTWRENTQFRFGYAFDEGASRNTGMNARVADNNGHRITLGAGGDVFGLHMDLAYAYTFYTKHTATASSPYNGTYRDRRQSLALALSKQF